MDTIEQFFSDEWAAHARASLQGRPRRIALHFQPQQATFWDVLYYPTLAEAQHWAHQLRQTCKNLWIGAEE